MKQRLTLLPVLFLLLFYACTKTDRSSVDAIPTKGENEIVTKFFSTHNIDPITSIVLNEIKRRNNEDEFVSNFSQTSGFPIWEHALVSSNQSQDTIVFIPLVLYNTRFTNGFIRAVINKGITISSFKSSEYINYSFNKDVAFGADNFVSLMMYFDNKVFRHERFILKDNRIFSNSLKTKNLAGDREIKLFRSYHENPNTKVTCQYFTLYIDWLVPDAGNCTCYDKTNCDWATGCSDCSNTSTSYFTYSDCGGSSGTSTSSVGTWSPSPPPGGGGSNTITTPSGGYLLYPNTQQYHDFVDYTLTSSERFFWNNPNKAEFVSPLIRKLVQGNYSSETVTFIKFWLNYLMGNPSITSAEFENYFMYDPQFDDDFGTNISGQDGVFDASFWDNPNLFFQQSPLPSFKAFISAFPKVVNPDNTISYMPSSDVYTLVGGNMDVQNKLPNPQYQNACAIRGSRALNYSGHPIDNTATATDLGNDGKKYIINAKAFNRYMNKKYGAPTYRLTKAQINGNPDNIKNFLRGKNGIYSMVTSGGSFSGHVDLIINGVCLSGSATGTIANVDYIEIWELQ